MTPLRVLVVGSGIAGVTAAHALARDGHAVSVFEKGEDVSRLYVGSGMHLWNNTMRALKLLGLDDRVAAVSGPTAVVEHMQFKTPRGRVLATVPVGEIGRRVGGDCIGVNRAALLPALARALDAGVIRTGRAVTGFTQGADGVAVRFADGDEERGDLLLGADGLRSTIRAQVLGVDEPPRYAGYTIWQGQANVGHDVAPTGLFPIVYGRGLRFAHFRVNDDLVYWFGVANAPQGVKDPVGRRREIVLERYRGWPAPAEQLVQASLEETIHRTDLYDRPPVTRWGEGRVTLLGDAAHPMTFDIGQGAGQGIEDALVLALCLREGGDVAAALRRYEQRRIPRTLHMQNMSRRVGMAGTWTNPLAVAARNTIQSGMRLPLMRKQFEKNLAYEF